MALTGFNHTVKWNEFRVLNQRPSGETEDAYLKTRYDYNFDYAESPGQNCRVTSATVTIRVDRSESWVVRGQQSTSLLNHEQGHYNITALGARALYNQILHLTMPSCQGILSQVRILSDQIQRQIDRVNARYDQRTNHGTNASAQRTWNSSIQSAMRSAGGTLANLPQ